MGIILLYHRIATSASDPWALDVSPENFAHHVAVVRDTFRPASLQELLEDVDAGRPTSDRVAVTFDDGYANNLHQGLPILESAGVPATFFVPSGSIDCAQEFWWDELDAVLLSAGTLPAHLDAEIDDERFEWTLGEAACYSEASSTRHREWVAWEEPPTPRHALYRTLWAKCLGLSAGARANVFRQLRSWAGAEQPIVRPSHRTMSTAELVQLARSSIVEIAGHSVTHPKLSSLSPSEQRVEIRNNKRHLETLVGGPLRSFSYPFGKETDYTAETIDLVREAGYTSACCNVPGVVEPRADPLRLPRYFVNNFNRDRFSRWLSRVASCA